MTTFIIKTKSIVSKIGILFFWILLWKVISFLVGEELLVPSPYNVLIRLFYLIGENEFWKILFYSISRVSIGILISIIVGVSLGILSGIKRYIYDFFKPIMVIIKSTPVVSFIVLALIWLKSDILPIFICFLVCFPIIWTNTVEGIRNIDKGLLDMAKVYNLKKTTVIKKIYIPSIRSNIMVGIITSIGLGWKSSIAAEVLGSPKYGIGSNLHTSKVFLDTETLLAWTIIVICLSYLFEILIEFLFKIKDRKKYD